MRSIFIFVLLSSFLYGHKLNVFLQQNEQKVYVSAYFASGAVCKSCKVEVFNQNKKVLQRGATNDKGEFEVIRLDGLVTVEVDAGSGHMVQGSIHVKKSKKVKTSDTKIEALEDENRRLKRENKLLKEKNSLSDIFKMFFALLVIFGVFFVLKRVKK